MFNPERPVTILRFPTYLALINHAVGSNLFRSVIAKEGEQTQDILQDGKLSCAYFVSSILRMVDALNRSHTTVVGTVRDLQESGWQPVGPASLDVGDVVVWNTILSDDGSEHAHIGFYIGNNCAVSTSAEHKTPIEHNVTFDGSRSLESAWRYPWPDRA